MNNKIPSASLQKIAGIGALVAGKAVGGAEKLADNLVVDPVIDTAKGAVKSGINLAIASIPVTALTAAYLASVISSPKAQASVAEDVILNAVERESLATSMRDLAELRRHRKLDKAKANIRMHDQFI